MTGKLKSLPAKISIILFIFNFEPEAKQKQDTIFEEIIRTWLLFEDFRTYGGYLVKT